MKKSIFLFILIVLGQTSFAYDFSAVASSGQTLYFNINGSNITVTSQNSSSPYWNDNAKPIGALIIPSSVSYNGTTYTVTSIGSHAFFGCDELTSVIIPNSVTTLYDYTFAYCSNLTSVTIPNTVTSIGNTAFYDCSNLTSVAIPNSVTSIGNDAFEHCTSLTSINIPNSITILNNGVFYGCTSLVTVTIPSSVTSIGANAFGDCWSLTSLIIPSTVTSIGYGAFYNCYSLGSVSIPNNVVSIGNGAFNNVRHIEYYGSATGIPWGAISINGVVEGDFVFNNIMKDTLIAYIGNSGNAIIPSTVTIIGEKAFYSCASLMNTTIPNTVTYIGTNAFRKCSNLTEITIFATIPPTLGNYTFNNVADSTLINIPCGSLTLYQSSWSYFSNFMEPIVPLVLVETIDSTMGFANLLTNLSCYDSTAEIDATSNYGYHFTHWSDGNTDNPRTVTLTQDTSFTAYFAPNQYTITGTSANEVRGCVTGGSTVDYLDSVTLTATANYGYHFDHWNDMNTDNPRQVQVTQDHTYTAYFDYNQYSITLNVDTSIHGTCSGGGSYNYLSNRTIAANANYGYHFTQWNDGNTNNPRTITLIQDTSFTAQFAKNQYTVNVAASHTDRGNVTGGGTVYYLDSVTATAIANYGYHFDHWSDGSAENPHTVAVTQNVTLTAFFVPNQYALAVVSADETGGHVSGGGNYDYMSNRTITATPNYGYHFTQWNDGVATSTRTITLTQDTTFTASFAPNQYNLTAVSADETMGTVSGGGTYDYGNNITVTANPVEHFHFLHWNDGNTDNPRTVVIEGDRTLTAFFAIDTHTVSVTVNDISRGMVEASGTEFVYGTPCTVTATAYSGYVFSHWSNNVTYNPYTFAVMEDVELTAIFVEEGTQGISDVSDINGFKVYTKGCSIHINGIEGQYVSVYSVDGRIIATKQNTTEQEPIPVPTTGVYFIKVGEYPARKVIVVR